MTDFDKAYIKSILEAALQLHEMGKLTPDLWDVYYSIISKRLVDKS